MKLTVSQLRKIIKEEVARAMDKKPFTKVGDAELSDDEINRLKKYKPKRPQSDEEEVTRAMNENEGEETEVKATTGNEKDLQDFKRKLKIKDGVAGPIKGNTLIVYHRPEAKQAIMDLARECHLQTF